MSDVEFSEEEAFLASLRRPSARKPVSKGLLVAPIRMGLVKSEAAAAAVLGGIALGTFALAVIIFLLAL
jgi:hypothetical protein